MPMPRCLRAVPTVALLASAAVSPPGPAAAQSMEGQVGRFYDGGGWVLYRVGFRQQGRGPLGLAVHGSYFGRGESEGAFAGLGADVTAFRGGAEGPYLVAGLGAGLGSPSERRFTSLWGSWSAGAGYELFPASFVAFSGEVRWREVSLGRQGGFELAAGLSLRFGGAAATRSAPRAAPSTAAPPPVGRNPVSLRDSIVSTATDAMGRPYRYGGTGDDGGGFDCSGLIQYAYGRYGIALPRTSREQATEGRSVKRRLDLLAPGDLLTFSDGGGPVTHVGMYVGEGRFIHSASRGVQLSVLSADDPYGRWWYGRWVGARRIVE